MWRRPRPVEEAVPPAGTSEALEIKRAEATRQLEHLERRRSDFRTQTGRIFVFLGALVAFTATQVARADTSLEQIMLGATALAGVVPLILIRVAAKPPTYVDLDAIPTTSRDAANEALLEQTQRAIARLQLANRQQRVYLVAAEKASAIIAIYLVGLALALLVVDDPTATSDRAYAAYALAATTVLLIIATCLSARRTARKIAP